MNIDYRNCTAWVGLDADETRVVWYVCIETLDGVPVDRRPFRSREEAEELADRINNE